MSHFSLPLFSLSFLWLHILGTWAQSQDYLRRGDLNLSPDENVDQPNVYQYPSILVCLLVRSKAHTLPYFFGQFEDLEYPKDQISWFIRSDHNLDQSGVILRKWAMQAKDYYRDIDLEIDDGDEYMRVATYPDEIGPHDWTKGRFENLLKLKEECLEKGRKDKFERILFIDADQFLMYKRTLQMLVQAQKTVIAPVLRSLNSNYSNFWAGRGSDGYYQRTPEYIPILRRTMQGVFRVPMVHSTFLVDLGKTGSGSLTFDHKKLTDYTGPIDDLFIFSESCLRAGVHMFAINTQDFGYLIEQPTPEAEDLLIDENSMIYLATEALYHGPPGLLYSPLIDKPFPVKDTMGFDKIYLINLPRRKDRKSRMMANLDVLGINVTFVDAVDGSKLDEMKLRQEGIKQIKEYADPFHKRPMTMGEVGCFLSHYYIWKDVLHNKYQKVLVLEDDLRFVKYFRFMLDTMFGDINEQQFDWDLIYLGRKRLNPDLDGPMVDRVRYLAHVSYSYWTLAYALSYNGAKILVEEEPLPKLVPVDEYLPIMFNRHPEKQWAKYYDNKNLKAFTAEPLFVYPTHYTGEVGYISDTEDTPIALPVLQTDTEQNLDLETKFEASRDEL